VGNAMPFDLKMPGPRMMAFTFAALKQWCDKTRINAPDRRVRIGGIRGQVFVTDKRAID
jgi:hypothetical protein